MKGRPALSYSEPEVPPQSAAPVSATISPRLLVERSAARLADIARLTRVLEADCLMPLRDADRMKLQAFDLIIQQIEGLSAVLLASTSTLSAQTDPRLDRIVASLRLQVLADGLAGRPAEKPNQDIDLF